MLGPTVHELEQCRARNEFLEREHARLMLVVSEQADTIASLRASPGRLRDALRVIQRGNGMGIYMSGETAIHLASEALAPGQKDPLGESPNDA